MKSLGLGSRIKVMKINISKKVKKVPPSGIRAFFDLVLEMDDVISLGVGEPDFVSPWNVCEAAIHSIENGLTSYTSNKGMIELRLAISEDLRERYKIAYHPDSEILITVGVSEALDLALRAILDPGDTVLIPEPCYVSYHPLSELAGGKAVYVPTTLKTDFKLTPQILKKHIDPKVRAIIFNYPSNPTGTSYSKKELLALSKIFLKHKIAVISDEIYGELTYDNPHVPFPTLPGVKDLTIYLNGFSKVHAMTGWRIGYACGPRHVIEAMEKIHQYSIMCAPIAGQIAGIEAVKNSANAVRDMKREYFLRREFLVSRLNHLGLDCLKPEGAFYVFPSIKKTGLTDLEFSRRLLEKENVAVVPGSAFGPSGKGHIRMAYASSMIKLKEAMLRIERFCRK